MGYYGITDLTTYVIGAIGIILLPGPNSLYVLSIAGAQGVKRGYQAACGVFVGDTILLLLVALGAAGLLHTYPALFMLVKYAGAAYLSWVGLNLIYGAFQRWRAVGNLTPSPASQPSSASGNIGATGATESTKQDYDNPIDDGRTLRLANTLMQRFQTPFTKALVISLLNPKAILFLLSFFIQFIDPSYPRPAIPFLILSAILMFFSFVYLSIVIVAGARLADAFRNRQRLSAPLSALVGTLFIWFAAKLATSSLR